MFKVGQKVRCIDVSGDSGKLLTLGDVYEVVNYVPGVVFVRGVDQWLRSERFEAIPDELQEPAAQDTYHRPVWIVRGFNGLTEKDSLNAAEELAKDLARTNPGKFFTVLSPTARYTKADVNCVAMDLYTSAAEFESDQIVF